MSGQFDKISKRDLQELLKEQRKSVRLLKDMIEQSELLVQSGSIDLKIGEEIEDLANALLDIGDLIAEARCKALVEERSINRAISGLSGQDR